jgi:small-conductance mechanosensitive channel
VIPAGSSVSGPWGGSYLEVRARQATGQAAQDLRAPCALSGVRDQGPARGTSTRKTGKCRSPPANGRRANPLPEAAAQPTRFELLNVQTILLPPSKAAAVTCQEPPLIILGVILLIIGFITGIAILWTIGIIALVVGVILALLGMAGHAVGGRRHYF